MPRRASLSSSSSIPTRPTLASRSATFPKYTPSLAARPLPGMPPVLLNRPYIPDADFQSNSVLRPLRLVGLGIGCVDMSLSRSSMSPDTNPYYSTNISSFDYEKSMASMKIEDDSVSLEARNDPSPPNDELVLPQFNSLIDLDVQFTSSRSLNTTSPGSMLNHPYTPSTRSSSWSLNSVFTSTSTSPEDVLASSSSDIRMFPAAWSSSSKLSTSRSSLKEESDSGPSLYLRTPDMAAPLVDINMYLASSGSQSSNDSIDPLYITAPLDPSLPSSCRHVPLTYDEDVFQSTSFVRKDYTRSLMHTSLPVKYTDAAYTPPPHSGSLHTWAVDMKTDPEDHSLIPSTSSCALVPRPRITKRKSSTQDVVLKAKKEDAHPFIPGTPVLDAHHGIDQAELEAKARRYQQRNPGARDFDKLWLAAFSGKLSAQGELIKDFRCYVAGCTQVNKRRDHMSVHVGSHLDQRPFRCEQCPSTFLRKNELKRHENGHDAARPFSCSHCKTTFRRQDLLTRHVKSKHAKGLDENKENARPRKKAKTF